MQEKKFILHCKTFSKVDLKIILLPSKSNPSSKLSNKIKVQNKLKKCSTMIAKQKELIKRTFWEARSLFSNQIPSNLWLVPSTKNLIYFMAERAQFCRIRCSWFDFICLSFKRNLKAMKNESFNFLDISFAERRKVTKGHEVSGFALQSDSFHGPLFTPFTRLAFLFVFISLGIFIHANGDESCVPCERV